MSVLPDEGRQGGRIEERADSRRAGVYAVIDPVTGKRSYLRETIKGTDRAARRKANSAMNKLLSQIDQQQSTDSSAPLGQVIDQSVADIEDSTREMYRGYLNRNIRPVIGDMPIKK